VREKGVSQGEEQGVVPEALESRPGGGVCGRRVNSLVPKGTAGGRTVIFKRKRGIGRPSREGKKTRFLDGTWGFCVSWKSGRLVTSERKMEKAKKRETEKAAQPEAGSPYKQRNQGGGVCLLQGKIGTRGEV